MDFFCSYLPLSPTLSPSFNADWAPSFHFYVSFIHMHVCVYVILALAYACFYLPLSLFVSPMSLFPYTVPFLFSIKHIEYINIYTHI